MVEGYTSGVRFAGVYEIGISLPQGEDAVRLAHLQSNRATVATASVVVAAATAEATASAIV